MSTKSKRKVRYLVFTLVPVVLLGLVVLAPTVSSAVTVPGTDSCAECHNDTTLITSKQTELSTMLHGTGTAYLRGTSASCAGCHSGGGFSAMVAAGQEPNTVTSGDPHPTRQDCRACHQIHVSYTGADWALETTCDTCGLPAPVDMFATGGHFDGGRGNLCAKCHQGRRDAPVASGGVITGISTHWGPHHGPQSDMMLGLAGVTASPGSPGGHYNIIGDTCVACHVDRNQNPADPASGNHTFAPDVSNCQSCHAGATNFDINGRQTSTQAQLDLIGAELVALGYLSSNDADGHPTTTSAPENIGNALWNWLYIAHEDGSLGVHNPNYTQAMLDEACTQLAISC